MWVFICGVSSPDNSNKNPRLADLPQSSENAKGKDQETQIMTVEQIESGAEKYIVENLSGNTEEMEVKVKYEGRDQELPKGKYRLVYVLPGGTVRTGRVPFSVRVEMDDGKYRLLHMYATISSYQDVVKLRKAFRRGQVLTVDDVETDRVKTTKPVFDAISQVEDAIGFEVSQNLELGKILTFGVLKKPYIVKRGDHILLVMDKGSMKITVPGIAKEQGVRGSTISVENLQSKKVVYGQILDEKTVQIDF
ncbi:MAG: flagella basal body P-ring formation protein FlgA [Nitrospinae bacterium RIFCSPLOWO2_12_FULL_47_7]|nr:MAG: flagella basal body P-ring formation protein FlgA [Nitrospinae bacterium RIFCSPLOWO2_12_FULL_47_7]